ncbi:phosphoribosyl-AMP cyclohydrolase family protein [Acinetobacter baumannii 25935_8]|nr:phosphoribosyl-AMP cyclohydrolase family protein [Acinetobacter baumannii 25935_8]
MNNTQWLDEVKFNEQGLIPAIAQHHQTGRILMVAWMNRESLALTAEKNQAVYFSRSRQKLWHKGEESGHFQTVYEIRLDCDGDVIVYRLSNMAVSHVIQVVSLVSTVNSPHRAGKLSMHS